MTEHFLPDPRQTFQRKSDFKSTVNVKLRGAVWLQTWLSVCLWCSHMTKDFKVFLLLHVQLTLLWEDQTRHHLLASTRLYFLPEDTPKGRTREHGEVGQRSRGDWLLFLTRHSCPHGRIFQLFVSSSSSSSIYSYKYVCSTPFICCYTLYI